MRKPPPERAVCLPQNQLRFFMASFYFSSLGVKFCLSSIFLSLLGSGSLCSFLFQAFSFRLSLGIVHVVDSHAVKVFGSQAS